MADWTMLNAKSVYGGNGSSYWRTILLYSVDNNYSATKAKITFQYGLHLSKELHSDHTYTKDYDTTYITCTGCTKKTYSPSGTLTRGNTNQGDDIAYCNANYFLIDKGTSAKTVTLSAYINHPKTYSGYIGSSTAKVSITISALAKYTVKFNANGGSGAPSTITHSYGYSFKIPSTKPTRSGYSFFCWNGDGINFYAGSSYTYNANLSLSAVWSVTNPPTLKAATSYETNNTASKNAVKGFSNVSVTVSDVTPYTGRTISSIKLYVNNTLVGTATGNTTFTFDTTNLSVGNNPMYIVATDSAGATSTTQIGNAVVVAPTWRAEVLVQKDDDNFPKVLQSGDAVVDQLLVKNYTKSAQAGTDVYDSMYNSGLTFINHSDSYWGFYYTFDEDHVSDKTLASPTVEAIVYYRHFEEDVSESRKAFFSTSRNQNYSNGIYNVMFVSGCDNEQFTEYTSRVWWSAVNDPLYFPDLNYSEVGSNDTAIQGLTKVGDYLGVIKQSKTTDTAIYLLYPTSFDDMTTYAVKQGVQGVGALAKYSFNILGDETLFLSPKGVVAIVPTEDEEHKVQNRSYFVDKRMLAEPAIESAYSFVFDGKYYLALGDGKGSVYVLDGNQRNSWGNDRTNLVYECYYLENVPANCLFKYNDQLLFSTSDEVCFFGDGYSDAYDNLDPSNIDVPVTAEWSTILDDDGALHYNKTMQKKGNLVSLLPADMQVYFVEDKEVDEATFNKNKKNYYTLDEDGNYIQCTANSVYDAGETYYVQYRSATQVYVKKDDKEPVKIERKFGASSQIPSELFMNKKFKKYKRLQFIIRNDADEDFGVDSIVKNYTIGNYAKK